MNCIEERDLFFYPPTPGWFLIRTKCRQEQLTQKGLTEKGYTCYCPMVFSGSKRISLFPQYLFLYIKDFAKFHEVKYVPGLKKLVLFNSQVCSKNDGQDNGNLYPKPIHNGESIIKEIKKSVAYFNKRTEKPECKTYTQGDKISCGESLFQHLEASFIKRFNTDRSIVLISFIESKMQDDRNMVKRELGSKKINIKTKDIKRAQP